MSDIAPPDGPTPRILHLLNALSLSGAELMLTSAARELGAQRSTVLATGEQVGDFAAQLLSAGYSVVHLPFARSPRYFLALARLIGRNRFDIVHVHPERARLWHILLARLMGTAVVTTVHAEFPFTGLLRLRKALGRRLAARLGARFIACSRRVARNEQTRFGIAPRVILNWANPHRGPSGAMPREQLREQLALPDSAFVTLSIANEAPVKNLDALVEAVALTEAGHVHLHAGSVSPALRARAEQFAPDKIRFLGPVDDIARCLETSDALVCCSFAEGGPLVLLEAALSALPCVITDVGIVEDFRDLAGVRIVAPDPRSIARGIAAMRDLAPAQRHVLGQQLAAFALARHTPAVGGAQYAALYRSLAWHERFGRPHA